MASLVGLNTIEKLILDLIPVSGRMLLHLGLGGKLSLVLVIDIFVAESIWLFWLKYV